MTLKTEKYARTPFFVDAVKVTEENFNEVANWCGGVIRQTDERGNGLEKYIFVHAHTPMSERQKMAFVGQWVLKSDKGFKVFPDDAFKRMFEKVIFEASPPEAISAMATKDRVVLKPETPKHTPSPEALAAMAKESNLKGLKPEDWKEKFDG